MADIFPADWQLVVESRPALAGRHQPAWTMPWAAGGSLGFHAAIVVMLALLPAVSPLLLPKEQTVTVEILSADQLAAPTRPPRVAEEPPAPLTASRRE
jgi:hypothetical protein